MKEAQHKQYISARTRLEQLPEVFTGTDLSMLFQWSSQTASSYLAAWRRAGLVRSLGGRTDVHLNLVANRHADAQAALRRYCPQATRLGLDVLREAGWTTQIPRAPEVAVPEGSLHALPDFDLVLRRPAWFARVAPGVLDHGVGLRVLAPAWALADMLSRRTDARHRDAWLPAADDLDFQAIVADAQVAQAAAAFGLPLDLFTPDGFPN